MLVVISTKYLSYGWLFIIMIQCDWVHFWSLLALSHSLSHSLRWCHIITVMENETNDKFLKIEFRMWNRYSFYEMKTSKFDFKRIIKFVSASKSREFRCELWIFESESSDCGAGERLFVCRKQRAMHISVVKHMDRTHRRERIRRVWCCFVIKAKRNERWQEKNVLKPKLVSVTLRKKIYHVDKWSHTVIITVIIPWVVVFFLLLLGILLLYTSFHCVWWCSCRFFVVVVVVFLMKKEIKTIRAYIYTCTHTNTSTDRTHRRSCVLSLPFRHSLGDLAWYWQCY